MGEGRTPLSARRHGAVGEGCLLDAIRDSGGLEHGVTTELKGSSLRPTGPQSVMVEDLSWARAQLTSILSIPSPGLPRRYWCPQGAEPKLGTSAQLWHPCLKGANSVGASLGARRTQAGAT